MCLRTARSVLRRHAERNRAVAEGRRKIRHGGRRPQQRGAGARSHPLPREPQLRCAHRSRRAAPGQVPRRSRPQHHAAGRDEPQGARPLRSLLQSQQRAWRVSRHAFTGQAKAQTHRVHLRSARLGGREAALCGTQARAGRSRDQVRRSPAARRRLPRDGRLRRAEHAVRKKRAFHGGGLRERRDGGGRDGVCTRTRARTTRRSFHRRFRRRSHLALRLSEAHDRPLPDRRHGSHGVALGSQERLRPERPRSAAGVRAQARRTRLGRPAGVSPENRHRPIGTILIVALSGFVMGFDGSLFTGAVGFIQAHFALNAFEVGWAVTSMAIAASVAIFVTGPLADRFGRRTMLRLATCIFIVASTLAALSENFATLIVARLLSGFGVGAVFITAPMYIAEISPSAWRGRMVSSNQLFIVMGGLLAYLSNYLIVRYGGGADGHWRWMLGIGVVPAIPYIFALFAVPESPRW